MEAYYKALQLATLRHYVVAGHILYLLFDSLIQLGVDCLNISFSYK